MALTLIAEQDFAGHQVIGHRPHQEDAYLLSAIPADATTEGGLLMLVADGMGGHAAGGRASTTAVGAFAAAFHREAGPIEKRLKQALDSANEALAMAVVADFDHLEGMGTTLLAAVVTPLGLEWISVGDSPLYLFREGTIRRVNADHSFRSVLQEMVKQGELTEQQASTSALRNRLRSALMGQEIALVDWSRERLPLQEGDVILAGTDGLQTLSDDELGRVLRRHASMEAASLATVLVQWVMGAAAPRQDNTTAAILKPRPGWLRTV